MKQNERFTPLQISDFSGGINQELEKTDIADNQCYDILNMFFDNNTNLVTRYGCTKVNSTPSVFGSRITSIFPCYFGSPLSCTVILTSGSKVYQETDFDTYIDITGSSKIPNDVFWSWKQFDDLIIGCNGGLSASNQVNPVKWDGKTSTIEQLLDGEENAPAAKFCEVFGNRLFLVSAEHKNLIYYSKLGDPENFTVGGGSFEVDKDDGDEITGIFAHRKRLFIFKRQKIYVLTPGSIISDDDQWTVELYAPKIGCLSHWTIQSILNDVVFLSKNGLASLQSADANQEFVIRFLSKPIPDLVKYTRQTTGFNKFASVVKQDDVNSEYWIAVPNYGSGVNNGVVYILDYKKIADGVIRWTRFNGLPIGVSYANVTKNGQDFIYIGSNDKNLYKYGSTNVYSDNGSTFTKQIISKSYNFENKIDRKEIESVALKVINKTKGTTAFSINFSYCFDDKTATKTKTNTVDYTETLAGSVWNETTPAIGTWASLTNTAIYFVKKVITSFGRRFINIEFTISDTTLNQAFVLQTLAINLSAITSRKSGNST